MAKTIIVKIGSSVLFTNCGKLDEFRVFCLIDQVQKLHKRGYFVILVVSGAVAFGSTHISSANQEVQAGVGQALLISRLVALFWEKKCTIAQILLTQKDMEMYREQLQTTISEMEREAVIPVFNENDVVELTSFGGNDLLAARLCEIFRARLVILSTWEKNRFGVGGGATKIEAVKRLKKIGIAAVIQNGKESDCLLQVA